MWKIYFYLRRESVWIRITEVIVEPIENPLKYFMEAKDSRLKEVIFNNPTPVEFIADKVISSIGGDI